MAIGYFQRVHICGLKLLISDLSMHNKKITIFHLFVVAKFLSADHSTLVYN